MFVKVKELKIFYTFKPGARSIMHLICKEVSENRYPSMLHSNSWQWNTPYLKNHKF